MGKPQENKYMVDLKKRRIKELTGRSTKAGHIPLTSHLERQNGSYSCTYRG